MASIWPTPTSFKWWLAGDPARCRGFLVVNPLLEEPATASESMELMKQIYAAGPSLLQHPAHTNLHGWISANGYSDLYTELEPLEYYDGWDLLWADRLEWEGHIRAGTLPGRELNLMESLKVSTDARFHYITDLCHWLVNRWAGPDRDYCTNCGTLCCTRHDMECHFCQAKWYQSQLMEWGS